MVETQYIDIFTQFRQLVDENSAPGLNACRDKALEAFQQLGFPTNKVEEYHNTNVAKFFEQEYGLNIRQLGKEFNPYAADICNVPDLSSFLFFLVNDLCYNQNLPTANLPEGVYVGSMKEFAQSNPDVFAKYYGQIADVNNNGVVAFNTMFAQDGFLVYVPKNVEIDKPLQLINVLQSRADYLVNRRILVIAEDGAKLKLLACDHTVDDSKFLVTQVTEIFAGKGAVVDFYELEVNSESVIRLASTFVHQEASSNVLSNNVTLQCGITRNNYRVKLAGEHAKAYVCGIVVAEKDQQVDNHAFLDHAMPNCESTQLFKYILQDNAIGAFCGRILVEKDAQKTQAYQTNRNLCTSPSARMFSKPQLEIYADDVKCSHGLTTGQLDEDALFYMRSRGIPRQEAHFLLMQAFAIDVLQHIRVDSVRERLIDLLEKRFKGEVSHCGNCAICK